MEQQQPDPDALTFRAHCGPQPAARARPAGPARRVAPLWGKEFLRTGDLARAWRVAPRTVAKWCDVGLLRVHRLPGRHGRGGPNIRRVRREDALAFARDHGLPTDLLEPPPGGVSDAA